MAQISHRLVFKMLAMTVALSTLGLANAQADVDPAVCGLGGAVAGGVIGHQFGGGRGKDVMTILGAIAGAAGGASYCKQANNSEDIRIARQSERQMLMNGGNDSYAWSNPRYGRQANAQSRIERRGWYGQRECTMTRSIMQSNDGGRYVNESYWCNDGGNWTQVTETTTIQRIDWTARGPVQSTTTQTTTTYSGGPSPMRPMPPRMEAALPRWIVNENRIARYQYDLRNARSHPEYVAREIAGDLGQSNQFITLDQLGQLMRDLRYDIERERVLRVLAPYVDQQFGSIASVTRTYEVKVNAYEARRILDEAQRQKERGPRRDGRRGDRTDDRNDRDDGRRGSPHRR